MKVPFYNEWRNLYLGLRYQRRKRDMRVHEMEDWIEQLGLAKQVDGERQYVLDFD